MGINNSAVDKTEETAAEFEGSGKATGFENVKKSIAVKLHNIAEVLGESGGSGQAIRHISVRKAGLRVVGPISRVRSTIRL